MESSFITGLTSQATILYASESIADILGFCPEDVIGRSCFEYFRPDEIPAAENIYNRAVGSDKAAALYYADIRRRDGQWVDCECIFTVVYEVLVACTSIYKDDERNERRAEHACAIRRRFTSSLREPRHHMLVDMSSKFRTSPQAPFLEPRAALILNRFTRTLTVMYATNAVTSILGVTPEQLKDKSLYECMQGNCLPEAIRCLESAKTNDSIAYLRFWRRDPRRDEDFDEELRNGSQRIDSEDVVTGIHGYVHIKSDFNVEGRGSGHLALKTPRNGEYSTLPATSRSLHRSRRPLKEGTDLEPDATHATLDWEKASHSSTSSFLVPTTHSQRRGPRHLLRVDDQLYEIEAIISCTSDGLVAVMRRGRPALPSC